MHKISVKITSWYLFIQNIFATSADLEMLTVIVILVALASVKEVQSRCTSPCPDNGCTHHPELGWVSYIYHDII